MEPGTRVQSRIARVKDGQTICPSGMVISTYERRHAPGGSGLMVRVRWDDGTLSTMPVYTLTILELPSSFAPQEVS